MIKKKVIPEVKFDLKSDEYPEIREQIERRGWQFLCNSHTDGPAKGLEFRHNAWIIYKDLVQGLNEKNYQMYVREKVLDFNLGMVRATLRLPPPTHGLESYRLSLDGGLNQLSRHDLKLVVRRWLEFIQHSILLTSNRSECTVDRAMMIHCIMIGYGVAVEYIIPQQIYNIDSVANTHAKLAFSHLIYQFCKTTGVHIENDFPNLIERLISKKTIEHAREYIGVPRRKPEEEDQQTPPAPFVPQEHYFLPQEYWQQLTSSLEQMRITQDSHNVLLHQIMTE
ncbi:hypothetical protein AHAS_Ahas07G0157200 [Arachis hypogaea]